MTRIGIDVSIARTKRLAIAVVQDDRATLLLDAPYGPGIVRDVQQVDAVYTAWAAEVVEFLRPYLNNGPVALGIDAPAVFPPAGTVRPCEAAVRAVTGIYYTPDRHTALHHPTQFYHWMLAGVGLWDALRAHVAHHHPPAVLREVFPHLGYWRLGIRSRKQTPQGLADRRALLRTLTPPLTCTPPPTTHDHADALLCAYLATAPDAVCYGSGGWADGIWG